MLALVLSLVAFAAEQSSAKRKAPARSKVRRSVPLSASQLERLRVRSQQVAVAARVNVLKASSAKVAASLRVLRANVRKTSSNLDSAERRATQSEKDAAAARRRQEEMVQRNDGLRLARRASALAVYTGTPSGDLSAIFGSDSVGDAGAREVLSELGLHHTANRLDVFNQVEEDLVTARKVADRDEALAKLRKEQVARRLRDQQVAKRQQERVGADTEARIEAAAAESAALSDIDKKLSARILGEQAAALAELRKIQVRGGGGKLIIPRDVATGASGGTHGIRVATSIQDNLSRLLAAAQRNGIFLSGGGYRSPSAQVSLRIAHCGSGTFAVYQMRASACHPPTARPGQSMHERGLAVDFTQNGATLTRGSSGYRWMRAHATAYGFFNLPSEPWHWSVNGK